MDSERDTSGPFLKEEVYSDVLVHLSAITRKYWEIVDNAPCDFLSEMLYHLQTIMKVLIRDLMVQFSSSRRRSTLLTDIGTAYALRGEVEEACIHFHQALDITVQTKALLAFQRIYLAQRQLDQWKNDPQVEKLDEHSKNTITTPRSTKDG